MAKDKANAYRTISIEAHEGKALGPLERFTLAWRTRHTNPKRQRGDSSRNPRWRFGLV
jgi:hypothetical protein